MSFPRQSPRNRPTAQLQASTSSTTLQIRSTFKRGGNLLLDLPIAGRLTLGFLMATLTAALATGVIGLQQTQSLNRQSDFYQNLLSTNTTLTTGANFLQLMNTEIHVTLDNATSAHPSQETLTTDSNAIQGLVTRYDTILSTYLSQDLLSKHPDQVALLAEVAHQGQVDQQATLTGSTIRTWQVYRAAQQQIIQNIHTGHVFDAQHLEQVQGEPTNADALSALRALIQFDGRLAISVHDVAGIEAQNQLFTTIISSVIAFLGIGLVGWFISSTLVRRLRQLHHVTRAVERGELSARVVVIGRDEIADVSASVNAMLTAIVGLLDETRHQRDALTNAADHLFSDMRIVSAGDLRVNAVVSNDPIGMLANAFNFTVGRFRRFVLRTQIIAEQLDVISRQEFERSENFIQALNNEKTAVLGTTSATHPPVSTSLLKHRVELQESPGKENADILAQVQRTRNYLQQLNAEGVINHAYSIAEQISISLSKLNKVMATEAERFSGSIVESIVKKHIQDLHALTTLLSHHMTTLQNARSNILREYHDLDADLAQIAASLHTLRPKSVPMSILSEANAPHSPDLIRLGTSFASDVTTMAHQLATLAREMRTSVVSFQLDSTEVNGSTVLNTPTRHKIASSLESDAQPLPPRHKNVPTTS